MAPRCSPQPRESEDSMSTHTSPWKVTASRGGGEDFKDPAPEGVHRARLVALVDLGTHSEEYQGKPRDLHKVFAVWELVGCHQPGSTLNYVIAQDYTLSF